MNALRSSPFLSPAWVLHAFIRSCWLIVGAGAPAAERHCFMNALRSSPFLSAACVLQAFILFCWLLAAGAEAGAAVCAKAGAASTPPSTIAAMTDCIFIVHSHEFGRCR